MIKVVMYFLLIGHDGSVKIDMQHYPQRSFQTIEECEANARQQSFMPTYGDVQSVYTMCEYVKEVSI